jgi:uncharacterized protein YfiM (DUF2279 family)
VPVATGSYVTVTVASSTPTLAAEEMSATRDSNVGTTVFATQSSRRARMTFVHFCSSLGLAGIASVLDAARSGAMTLMS